MDLPPCDTELVLIVDTSLSMKDDEVRGNREAIRHALTSPNVIATIESNGRGCAILSLIEFSTRVNVSIPPMMIRSVQDIQLFISQFPEGTNDRGQTNLGSAITTADGLLTGNSFQQVFVIIGDGKSSDRLPVEYRPSLIISSVSIGDVDYSSVTTGYKTQSIKFSYEGIERLLVDMLTIEGL